MAVGARAGGENEGYELRPKDESFKTVARGDPAFKLLMILGLMIPDFIQVGVIEGIDLMAKFAGRGNLSGSVFISVRSSVENDAKVSQLSREHLQ